jgi:hypothetical protein
MKTAMSDDGDRVGKAGDTRRRLRATLDIGGRVKRNPYGMMAGAVGVGFLLGGGLFTRLAARICGVGLRIGLAAALPLLQGELVHAVVGLKSDRNERESD